MTEEKPEGCVQPAEGPILSASDAQVSDSDMNRDAKKELKMQVSVGKEAPDFGATAFSEGGFTNIKLSDFKGKWVFLCFYPGDFTFV